MKLAIGALFALIATVLINYSNFLQKRQLALLPRIGEEKAMKTVRAFMRCRPWLKAQGMQIGGAWIHNVAVGLAPLSVVQPINAAGICLLVFLAITRLKEKASVVDWIGIVSIVAGVLMLGVTLIKTETTNSAYRPVILWFFIILMAGVAVSTLYMAFTRKDERMSSLVGIGVGCLVGLTAIFTKMAWTDIGNRWGEFRVAGFIFSFYFWMAIITTLVAMVLFQTALQRGSAIVVVPLVTGFSNLIPIVVGFVAFREPFPKGILMISLRLGSILLIIGGAVLLSLRKEGAETKTVYKGDTDKASPGDEFLELT
ncbi:MAG TPA: DMT family transporter [Candidatus Anoxymicrobiaceae bacterium]|jgi:drug/metabolite transporter (DMT)-like permease